MSLGRSMNDAAWALGVPQVGNSLMVLPGCGGAMTMYPRDARSGVRNVLWSG